MSQPVQTIKGSYVLKVISGATKGTEFKLDKNSFTVGRSEDPQQQNHLVIPDNLVSRAHCRITNDDGKWFIEDLESTNGTWLVGQKVSRKVAVPEKTPIRIGNTLFEIFNRKSAGETISLAIPFITFRMQPETLAPATKSRIMDFPPDALRSSEEQNRKLAAIYKFQNAIASTANQAKLYTKILDSIIDVMTADRVFLLIYDLDSGKFEAVAGATKDGPIKEISDGEIKKTIVDFVRENRESVLSVDNVDGKAAFTNISGAYIKSSMCIPMLVNQQLSGMIYFELASSKKKYDEEDLSLATVITHSAALALENIRLLEFNLKNERLVATGATAAGLSHYIKNILAGLDGSLNLLQMAIDEKDLNLAGESLSILNKNHRRLGNLVLDLLNLTSEQTLSLKVNDVNAIIKDVAELMIPQMKQQGIELRVDPKSKDMPLYAEVDANGIHRVLLNLIINSEHAVQSKKETAEDNTGGLIYISAYFDETKEYLVISVTDNGIGISPDEAGKIFEIFFTSKGTAGTGLGLAVSKRIIDAHGGTITATGEKGKSCTISFTIPLSQSESNTMTHTIRKVK